MNDSFSQPVIFMLGIIAFMIIFGFTVVRSSQK